MVSHQILLTVPIHVVIVVQNMLGTNVSPLAILVLIVVRLVTLQQYVTVLVLPRTQDKIPGSVVEAEHPVVEGLLQDDKYMK